MRCFLAIPVPEQVAAWLADVAGRLRTGHPVPPENLHLTLAFLGEQDRPALEELHFGLERIRVPAFPVVFGPLGTFGETPASVHAEVRMNPGLEALHRAVQGAVFGAGITFERRRFRPHVTIARLPAATGARGYGAGSEVPRRPCRFAAAGLHGRGAGSLPVLDPAGRVDLRSAVGLSVGVALVVHFMRSSLGGRRVHAVPDAPRVRPGRRGTWLPPRHKPCA